MEPIYLEPDEEITSVIDKLGATSGGKLAIVVPKNSTLFQSLVNLKLLAKQARELQKDVVIVTGNKVGQRLAAQVGLQAFATLGTLKDRPSAAPAAVPATTEAETLPDGTPIRRYVPPQTGVTAPDQEEAAPEPAAEPIQAAPPPVEPVPVTPAEEAIVPDSEVVPTEVQEEVRQVVPAVIPVRDSEPEELPAIVSRTPVARQEFHFAVPWKSLIAAVVLLLIAFAITYVLLPKAKVTITLPANALSASVPLSIKTTPDGDSATVAGNLVSVEKSLTKPVTATGKKNIGTKATGSVPFRNCEDTNSHPVAAGTKVTASGKTFTTNSAVTIPAGQFSNQGQTCNSSSVTIGLTASDAGEAHNLANATFTINGLSAGIKGTGSTSGGTTKQVTVLSQEDVDRGLSELEKQAIDEAKSELQTKAEQQTLLEGALNQTVKDRSSDKKVGDQVDSATVKYAVELSALVFDAGLAEAKLRENLEKNLTEGQKLEIPETAKPALTFKGYSEDKTVLMAEISGNGYAVPDVNKSDLAAMVRHKPKSQAETLLKNSYKAEEVAVEITPSWWFGRLPILGQAITIEYGFKEKVEPLPTESQPPQS